MENHSFQADAKQILKLVTHSIYSEREVFLRELLSNSSDALDKARFMSLQNQEYRTIDGDASIRVFFDETEKTITIEDDGVGMSKEEIVDYLDEDRPIPGQKYVCLSFVYDSFNQLCNFFRRISFIYVRIHCI